MKKLSIFLNVFFIVVCVFAICSIVFSSFWLQSFVEGVILEAIYIPYAIRGISFSSAMIFLAFVTLILSCTFLYLLNRKTDGVSVMNKIAYGADEAKKVMEKKKADKEEARKQKRLEELQAEIDELKKDE